ncbi:MAG: type IV toxin-antitoxin system AbiEi family antitoxin domain-containing protein [Acholeplasmataceae bacterium]|jgi:predicted transcriptional regulator of viral defense system
MVYTTQDLIKINKNYSDVMGKISRDLRDEKIIQLKRGLYESDKDTPGYYLASYIYGPSYLSFDYVLSTSGLIPEGIYRTYTSATFKKNKKKKYSNYFGDYLYRDVPKDVFRFGVKTVIENGYSYQMASVEKALCDKLYTLNPVKNLRELKFLLFNDLRIDENIFKELDFDFIIKISSKYKSTNLNLLEKLIKDGSVK